MDIEAWRRRGLSANALRRRSDATAMESFILFESIGGVRSEGCDEEVDWRVTECFNWCGDETKDVIVIHMLAVMSVTNKD